MLVRLLALGLFAFIMRRTKKPMFKYDSKYWKYRWYFKEDCLVFSQMASKGNLPRISIFAYGVDER